MTVRLIVSAQDYYPFGIIGDILLNDTIKYFDLSDKLTSIKVFKNGIQEGVAVDFYSRLADL